MAGTRTLRLPRKRRALFRLRLGGEVSTSQHEYTEGDLVEHVPSGCVGVFVRATKLTKKLFVSAPCGERSSKKSFFVWLAEDCLLLEAGRLKGVGNGA